MDAAGAVGKEPAEGEVAEDAEADEEAETAEKTAETGEAKEALAFAATLMGQTKAAAGRLDPKPCRQSMID